LGVAAGAEEAGDGAGAGATGLSVTAGDGLTVAGVVAFPADGVGVDAPPAPGFAPWSGTQPMYTWNGAKWVASQ
jgi:hypothetical protein